MGAGFSSLYQGSLYRGWGVYTTKQTLINNLRRHMHKEGEEVKGVKLLSKE